MLRHIFIGLAAAALASASLIPDEALARGGRGGGFHGARGGAVGAYRGHVAHPIAGRGVAYRGAAWRGVRRGVAVGAAAGAVGAAGYYGGGYYNNDCYRDGYGRLICPNQNQY